MPKETPADRYVEIVASCRDYVQQIAEMLENLPAPNDEIPITWGYVDEVQEIKIRLGLAVDEFRERGFIPVQTKPEEA